MATLLNPWTVLVDLSGTIHIDDVAIFGAIEALSTLRTYKMRCSSISPPDGDNVAFLNIKFVTNTTKESKAFLLNRLRGIGFDVSEDEICTSLSIARDTIVSRNLKPFLMVEDAALEDFRDVDTTAPHNAVVVGLSPEMLSYPAMNTAFRLLLEQNACLIGLHKGRYYQRKDGLALGPGPFIAALEYATGAVAELMGKPGKSFYENAIKSVGGCAEQCFMIGDDVRDDVSGAQAIGIKGILVKTGKYRPGDEMKIDPKPWFVANNFPEAVARVLQYLETEV